MVSYQSLLLSTIVLNDSEVSSSSGVNVFYIIDFRL